MPETSSESERATSGTPLSALVAHSPQTEAETDAGHWPIAREQILRALIDRVPDYLFVKDTEGRIVIANHALAEDLGRAAGDLEGRTDLDLYPRERADAFLADEQAVIRTGEPKLDAEERVVTASGRVKWLAISKLPLRGPDGEVTGIVGIGRDITERKRAEEAVAEGESRWAFAFEGAGQGVWDHNLREGTAYFSPMWRRMRGIGPDEPVDASRDAWLERVHPDDRERLIAETDQQNSGNRLQNAFEYRERHRDGHYIWIMSRGRPVELMPDGSVARIVGTDTDITSLKLEEARAAEEKEEAYRRHLAALEKAREETDAAHRLSEALARHDALTGLPNRRVFAEMIDKAVSRARRDSVSSCVMVVDLDHFKPVNDINGHAAGDEVLREIAERLRGVSRPGDTVARLGGDEFGIILEGVAPERVSEAASALAERIITSVGRPIGIGDRTVEVGASIGMSICPDDGTDLDTLLRAADMAMYRAKEEGRGEHRFFERRIENALRERVAFEQDVRRAVTRQEIHPHYQPLLMLAENRVVGFEILARWTHPERGEVEPDVFIPVVEKLNLIGELTYNLLRRACLDARGWPDEITIALNVSPGHFCDPALPERLLAILSETGFPPSRLEIEVTETSLVANIDAARAAVAALQNIGIRISLDDFGTGYSSLYNLRELHFDKIKIDRSFISSMHRNASGATIVGSVIDLANSLGLPVIAEGIELHQELQEIIRRGGEYGQGFYFSRAVPASEATIIAQGGGAEVMRAAQRPEAPSMVEPC